jgi:hypothetical protein
MSRKTHSALLFLVLGLPLATLAADAAPTGPRLVLAPTAQGDGFAASVQGMAGDGCERRLLDARLDDRTVHMHARQDTRACLDEPRPYTLTADIASSLTAGVYRVRLESSSATASLPRLQAFGLVEIGELPSAARPEAGFWWGDADGEFDEARPGFGVQLEVQGDTLAVTVSGYDAAGEPQWLFGAGPLGEHVSRIALVRLRDGGGPFGKARSPSNIQPAGQLHIEWQGPARAVFWFEQPAADGLGVELRPMSMVRFGFAGDRQWLGRWLLAGERGEDDAIAARAIDFESVELAAGHFTTIGSHGERLACIVQSAPAGALPSRCKLSWGDDGEVEFDDVGLSRMHGSDAVHGQRAVLVRLDR